MNTTIKPQSIAAKEAAARKDSVLLRYAYLYDSAKGKWQQTWVDNTGNLLELYGEFKDGVMRLTGENVRSGKKTLQRLSFFPLEKDRVRQLWEQSQDDGKTWSVAFDGLYIRKGSAKP